jgi:hypothetical protein
MISLQFLPLAVFYAFELHIKKSNFCQVNSAGLEFLLFCMKGLALTPILSTPNPDQPEPKLDIRKVLSRHAPPWGAGHHDSVGPLDAVPGWGPFLKVGEADRPVELLKRLPSGSRSANLNRRHPVRLSSKVSP